jgi:hypothetical protein
MKMEINENATKTSTNEKLHNITCNNKSSEADSFRTKKQNILHPCETCDQILLPVGMLLLPLKVKKLFPKGVSYVSTNLYIITAVSGNSFEIYSQGNYRLSYCIKMNYTDK